LGQRSRLEPSKWDVTRDALRGALDALAGKLNVSVGVSVFLEPHDTENCRVAEEPDVAIVVLFTDGDENYLAQLVDRDLPLATRFNIKTFVIDGRALLSQMARVLSEDPLRAAV
jgi:hypothetical protein